MSDPKPKDKAEEEKSDIAQTPAYRKFRRLLKKVLKAPPLRDHPLRKAKRNRGA